MAILTPTTELEAVNSILSVIAESPIASLTPEEDLGADAALALNLLRKTSRAVQMRGWYWNTEEDYELTPNVSDQIELPSNTLRVDPSGSDRAKKYVERGRKLYDRTENTFTITEAVDVRIIFLLDFEDLPEAARHYIMVRAARWFQDRLLGDDSVHVYTVRDEEQALSDLEQAEADYADWNLGDNDPLINLTLGARRRRF